MSASLAGKFQDHYEVLGLDPKADSETLQRAYAKLAQKYHTNSETPDAQKFEAVNMAYEVLSDPALRMEFDKLKGVGAEEGTPKFSGVRFFEALGRETGLRTALLCILYDRRRTKPLKPSLSMRHVENMLHASYEEMSFAMWYLKQRNFAQNDDKSSVQITVEGMDHLESNRPSPELVMPFIKATALYLPNSPAETTHATPEPDAGSRPRVGARLVGMLKGRSDPNS